MKMRPLSVPTPSTRAEDFTTYLNDYARLVRFNYPSSIISAAIIPIADKLLQEKYKISMHDRYYFQTAEALRQFLLSLGRPTGRVDEDIRHEVDHATAARSQDCRVLFGVHLLSDNNNDLAHCTFVQVDHKGNNDILDNIVSAPQFMSDSDAKMLTSA